MDLSNINWLAVLVAGLAYFFLGALWYSPLLFARTFIRLRNAPAEEIQGQPSEYLMTLVSDLISAAVLAFVLTALNVADVGAGIGVGLLLALGTASTTTFTFSVYSGPSKGLWLLYSGYVALAYVVMSAILTLWR